MESIIEAKPRALKVETLFDLVPPDMRTEVAKVIHEIQNQLASVEMAGEILATPDLATEDRELLEALRQRAVEYLLRLVQLHHSHNA